MRATYRPVLAAIGAAVVVVTTATAWARPGAAQAGTGPPASGHARLSHPRPVPASGHGRTDVRRSPGLRRLARPAAEGGPGAAARRHLAGRTARVQAIAGADGTVT